MSAAKFLFDENFGGPIVDAPRQLVSFQRNPPAIKGIRDFILGGVPDERWVPQIAAEGWIVISADRGARSGGIKLPQVCAEHGVTHILLSEAIHSLPQFEKMRAILSVWPECCDLVNVPKGSRFKLKFNQDRSKAILAAIKGSAADAK